MSILQQQPEGEILGMGGPWMGELYWQGQRLPGHYLLQPHEVVTPDGHYVLTVETNQPAVSARSQVAFWLVAVAVADGRRYRSRQSWPALYVEQVVDGQVEFYPLFQAGKPEQKQLLPFAIDDNFQLVP